jgi:GDP-mannose 6-dehydrogenase
MSSKISIFGLGYVGSVMAASLAGRGVHVVGVDANAAKVGLVNSGSSPIVEKGIQELVESAVKTGRLRATVDVNDALENSTISFLCVGTPSLSNGKLDLESVKRVCQEIGAALRGKKAPHTVVLRSTVLPGTTESLVIPTLEQASIKREGDGFDVCVNPEFMREGTALRDFLEPSITVLGAASGARMRSVRELYSNLPGAFFETTIKVAEMVKYACNCFHALKVAFANELSRVESELGVDAFAVAEILCADTKLNISPAYLTPGFAFGGSCLPKDLRAVTYRAKQLDVSIPLLESILPSNHAHVERAFEQILRIRKKNVAVLGLSFKAGTDDLRESPFVQLIKRLLGEGCQIRIWDENVALGRLVGSNRDYINEIIPHIGAMLHESLESTLQGAEVVVLATHSIDKEALQKCIRPTQVVFDLVGVERRLGISFSATRGDKSSV